MNSKVFPISEYGAVFEGHVHGCFDLHDGVISPHLMAKLTLKKGFNFINAMQHDTIDGMELFKDAGKEIGIPVLPAAEISTNYNHILAYGLQEWDYSKDCWDPETVIERLREQDCAIYCSHPSVYQYRGKWDELVHSLDIDGIEWTNGSLNVLNKVIHNKFNNYGKGKVAGTDAHDPTCFGYTYTQVDVNSDDPDDLVDALKRGRCKPCGQYVPIILMLRWAIWSTIKIKVHQMHEVNGTKIPRQNYLRGLQPIHPYDGREWKLDFKLANKKEMERIN